MSPSAALQMSGRQEVAICRQRAGEFLTKEIWVFKMAQNGRFSAQNFPTGQHVGAAIPPLPWRSYPKEIQGHPISWQGYGSTVTGIYYANELCQLGQALKSKRWGKQQRGVLRLHDNVWARTASIATSTAAECRLVHLIRQILHRLLDLCLFPLLKKTPAWWTVKIMMTSSSPWRTFCICKINPSIWLVYKSCKYDGLSALKLTENM